LRHTEARKVADTLTERKTDSHFKGRSRKVKKALDTHREKDTDVQTRLQNESVSSDTYRHTILLSGPVLGYPGLRGLSLLDREYGCLQEDTQISQPRRRELIFPELHHNYIDLKGFKEQREEK